jgi:glycosyltransferase involved in cell wall biosynthesis
VGLTKKQKDKLPKSILGITKTNNVKELVEIYSTANVFMNPTLEEVLGLVNLEALACGTPVITFETGGSVECIDDSCGITVEKGNITKLMEAIRQINDNNYSIECCLERARLFNINNMLAKYEELYNGF